MIRYSYKFRLRNDRPKKDGSCQLFLQAFLGGHRVKIHMDMYVQPSEWDDLRQTVRIPKDRLRESQINAVLSKYKGRVEQLFFEARMTDTVVTPMLFTDELNNRPALESLVKFIEAEIEKERVDREASTVKQYISTMRHLQAFKPSATFADISFEFVQDFDRFLKKKKIGDNARAKYHTILRKFILLAMKKRRRITNPYEQFKVRSVTVERTWLNVEEVDALVKLYKSHTLGPLLQRALRQFLFQVVASVRVSDIHQLAHSDIKGDMLVLVPQKTKRLRKVVTIPLSSFARELIADGDGRNGYVFDALADQTTNNCLKEIARMVGIKKRITTHVGRHTFGFLYLLMGGKVEELREIMGHSKLETTQVYTHTDHDKKIAGVRRFDEVFKVSQ